MPHDVGDAIRSTAVGMVPLGLAQLDIQGLMEGAHQVYDALQINEQGHFASPEIARSIIEYAASRKAAWNIGKRVEVLAYPNPKWEDLLNGGNNSLLSRKVKIKKDYSPSACYIPQICTARQYLQQGCHN